MTISGMVLAAGVAQPVSANNGTARGTSLIGSPLDHTGTQAAKHITLGSCAKVAGSRLNDAKPGLGRKAMLSLGSGYEEKEEGVLK
jgi:hypothetical protein